MIDHEDLTGRVRKLYPFPEDAGQYASALDCASRLAETFTKAGATALRDQFALQCLHGIIDDCGLSADKMAERCYEVADAMLRARRTVYGPEEGAPSPTIEE